jgi:hypothetical protein
MVEGDVNGAWIFRHSQAKKKSGFARYPLSASKLSVVCLSSDRPIALRPTAIARGQRH